ncbi:MAG: hypothetical protein A3I66_10470 [Burkholderiales bacterium RIFCSPLOWO2_02_FULL_57_36]|nr:MAG: hypothetical protein A3I66_10470 [Burkholderiales bacterium RIFCSPLOWO2_02_FULL_57_36]
MPISRIFFICSGGIFGMFFIASDLMVISHKPGLIWLAAHTLADEHNIENMNIETAVLRIAPPWK